MGYPQNPNVNPQVPQQGQPQQPGGAYQPAQGGYAPVPQNAGGGLVGLQMKPRQPIGVWGLGLITFGIYNLIWYYQVHVELSKYDRRIPDDSTMALLSSIFGGITLGIWPLIVWFKLADKINQAQRAAGLQPSCSGGIGLLLGFVSFGSFYYQGQINRVIERYQGAPEGAQVPLSA